MTEKELEKSNFLTWCRDATTNDLENAKRENSEIWERLYSEYADEIDVISRMKHVYESISQHNIGVQRDNLSSKVSR